jgi:hypothetical protein
MYNHFKTRQFLHELKLTNSLKNLYELDVFDDRGNMIIGKDLKVRHKKTQLEYTVDDVDMDKDGELQIILRLPDEPRIEPPPEEQDNVILTARQGPDDPLPASMPSPEEDMRPPNNFVVIVGEKEFEKEYEVK